MKKKENILHKMHKWLDHKLIIRKSTNPKYIKTHFLFWVFNFFLDLIVLGREVLTLGGLCFKDWCRVNFGGLEDLVFVVLSVKRLVLLAAVFWFFEEPLTELDRLVFLGAWFIWQLIFFFNVFSITK